MRRAYCSPKKIAALTRLRLAEADIDVPMVHGWVPVQLDAHLLQVSDLNHPIPCVYIADTLPLILLMLTGSYLRQTR